MFLGFGDFVPLANVQRSGQSLYSRWGYFIFTVSFILFGLAIMASSLNLLVLRLAQFHSQSGTAGISSLLSRNEDELIAEAIAHHRASIHIQQLNRIRTNSIDVSGQQKLALLRRYSSYSTLTSSSSSSNSNEHNCCSRVFSLSSQKRKRRHWHLRRSPQNIKHLISFDQLLDHHRINLLRKSPMPPFNPHSNHLSSVHFSKQQRISI